MNAIADMLQMMLRSDMVYASLQTSGVAHNDSGKPPLRGARNELIVDCSGAEQWSEHNYGWRVALNFIPLFVDLNQPVLDGLEYCTHFLTCTHASRLSNERAPACVLLGEVGLRFIQT
jgi:hypothetical protein